MVVAIVVVATVVAIVVVVAAVVVDAGVVQPPPSPHDTPVHMVVSQALQAHKHPNVHVPAGQKHSRFCRL